MTSGAARVTVGLPVYNASAVIEPTLVALKSQDVDGLRVVVSDNASSDATVEICRDMVGSDDRFDLHIHDTNKGWQANFRHVLAAAETPLFMWLGADDRLASSYVSTNVAALDERRDLVGSVSRVLWTHDGMAGGEAAGTQPIEGTPEARVEQYLRTARDNSRFYGVFRTEALRHSFPAENFYGLDLAIMAGTLRFGAHGRVDRVLLSRERTDPSTYVRHIDADARGITDRVLPFRGLNRALRSMGVPVNPTALRWLLIRNGYEHVRYWAATETAYGRLGRAVMPHAERLRGRAVT